MTIFAQHSRAQEPFFFTSERLENYQYRKFIFGVSGGFGKYLQTDLKKINQDIQKSLSFETQLIDNFPAAFYYGMYFLFRLNPNISFGPDYQFHTTGSRLAYQDYSGTYTFDQILSCHSIAIRLEIIPGKIKNPQVGIDVLAGTGIATWKASEKLIVGEYDESSSYRFDAFRPFVHPGLKLRYSINSFISLVPSIGYNIDLSGKYHLHENTKAKTDYAAGWSGPRAELSIDLAF